MLAKLKSRKFILAVISGALVVFNQGLDLNLPSETILTFAGIVVAYILGESAVDAAAAIKK